MIVYCPRCGQPLNVEPEVKHISQMSYGFHVTFDIELIEHKCGEDELQSK